MRLLQAELLKFRRPLLLWVAVALIGFLALTAWGQVYDAATQYRFSQHQPDQGVIGGPSCADLGLPEGPQCEAARLNRPGIDGGSDPWRGWSHVSPEEVSPRAS
jgi:hypothetical protein